MAEPNLNPIYWSPRAQAFYQRGRRGRVSYEVAIKTLKYNESADRFIDRRGRFVPASVFQKPVKSLTTHVAYDSSGRPFLSTMTVEERISNSLAAELLTTRQLENNQQILITDIWTDGKGNVYTTYTSSVLGGRTLLEELEKAATNRMKGQAWEKSKITSGQWRDRFHISRSYSVKTVQNPRLARAA